MLKVLTINTAAALSLMALALPALAEDVTIRAVSGWQAGSSLSERYETFIDQVNERGEGDVRIDFLGGSPAIGSPLQIVKKVQGGVYGMAYITGGWYTNVLPEADFFKLSEVDIAELRQNGGYEYIQKLHAEKGLHYLGRTYDMSPYYLYLNKPIDSADLSGIDIRVSTAYQAFFSALGASTHSAPVPEVYTLMERGVVDGYGWVSEGIFDYSWDQVTDYRVEPGFFTGNGHVVMNLDLWESMSEDQQAMLNEMMLELERGNYLVAENDAQEIARQTEAGIETIVLPPDQAEIWSETARRVGWEEARKINATVADELRAFITQQ
ncbi:TRAP transporter substrate-binding protein DctP [Pontivivens nitratireducens]|uniref:TRAP transporter substrate-binding protein DctP n=1 Tax=Pontivivens nitratireducens TaxID=2758038 RepID=UPI001639B493|nr:TRAP transporter substrate-binding protein DctP [Pontibrevibacter nitratireducens]